MDKSSVVILQSMEQYDDQLGGAAVRHYSIHWSGALPRPGVSCRILASLSSTHE
jgi:hypothetical protein